MRRSKPRDFGIFANCTVGEKYMSIRVSLPGTSSLILISPYGQQGQRLVVENLLQARFGTLDAELINIIPSLLTQPIEEYTRLLLLLSREELIARFNQP